MLRILLVEDNEYNRVVAVDTLEMLLPGVTVVTVGNGREALKQIKTGDFDLVLMDVNMPEMDGLEATRAIRSLPAPLNALPVIAFTASVTKAEIQRCREAGMDAVVPKPFKESELMEALRTVLPSNSSDESKSSDVYAPKNPSDDSESSDGHAPAGLDFLHQLTGGNRERIRKYVGLYVASARTSLPKIETALAANDREALRRSVHTLKPQFKMVGLPQTSELAAFVEVRLLEGIQPDEMAAEIERLLEEIRRSCDVFEYFLRGQQI